MHSLELELQPSIISADHLVPPNFLRLIFDMPMLQVPVDPALLLFRFGNRQRNSIFQEWPQPDTLLLNIVGFNVDIGPDVTSSNGFELFLFSAEGIPANEWINFPTGQLP